MVSRSDTRRAARSAARPRRSHQYMALALGGAALSPRCRGLWRRAENGGRVATNSQPLPDRARRDGESDHDEGGTQDADEGKPEGGLVRPAGVDELRITQEATGEKAGSARDGEQTGNPHRVTSV